MIEEILKKIVRASVEAFPIDRRRKAALLKRILEDMKR
jgi:hypothetical protein